MAKRSAVKKDTSKAKSKVAKAAAPEKTQLKVNKRMVNFLTWVLIVVSTLIVVDLVVQYINNDYSVAIVNGERVSRSEFDERIEEVYGAEITTQLINEKLILQQAAEENVTVSDDEIDEIVDDTVERLGGEEEFDTALQAENLDINSYRRNIKLQLIAEDLIVEDPSDEELREFYDEFKDSFFPDQEYDDVKEDVEEAYRSQQFTQNVNPWLSEIATDADIQNNISEKPDYGLLKIVREAFNQLNDRVNN